MMAFHGEQESLHVIINI